MYIYIYLVDVFHHDALDLGDLGLHLGQPAHLLRVIHAVLHLLLQPRPVQSLCFVNTLLNHSARSLMDHHKSNQLPR